MSFLQVTDKLLVASFVEQLIRHILMWHALFVHVRESSWRLTSPYNCLLITTTMLIKYTFEKYERVGASLNNCMLRITDTECHSIQNTQVNGKILFRFNGADAESHLCLTAIQAWASIPHSMACLGFPRASSSFCTSSIIMVNEVLAWAFRSSAPSSGTVGPRPLGYCSVKMGGMPRIRLACQRRGETWQIWFRLSKLFILDNCADEENQPGAVWLHCWQCWWTGRCWVWTSPAYRTGKALHPWWRACQCLPLQEQGHRRHSGRFNTILYYHQRDLK